VYAEGGEYEVCLNIVNADGSCEDIFCDYVFVEDSIVWDECEAAFYWYPEMDSLEMGMNTIQFTDISYGDIVSWNWAFGDGSESMDQNPVHVYAEGGEYEVCLNIVNADGSCEDIFCDYVFVEDSIIWGNCEAAFYWYPAMDSLGMGMNTIQFTDISYGDIVSWNWAFGDGTESMDQNPVHVYAEGGEYEVCLNIVNADGSCEDIFCDYVFVEDSIIWNECEAYFEYYQAGDSLNLIEGYQFVDLSMGEASTWYWDFGDGNFSEEQNPMHEFVADGIYMVCLYIENEDMICSASYCTPVQVGEVETFEVYGSVLAGDDYLEQGEVLIIGAENMYFEFTEVDSLGSYHFMNVPQGDYYLWAFPAMDSSFTMNYAPTFYQSTLFWEEAQLISAAAQEDYVIQLVEIDQELSGICGIDGTISSAGRNSAFNKANIILTNEYDQIFKYELTETNGEFDFNNLDYGIYKVHVEVVGIVSNPVMVSLDQDNTQSSLNYTVEGGSILLSTKEVDALSHEFSVGSLYPNPAIDFVNIPVINKKEQVVNVCVYDVAGKMVESISNRVPHGSHSMRINTQNLKQGVYQVMILTNNGSVITKKLVK
ncbi:MAG: PKD domain-containing protein, partial [Bacteroidales bacterium]|nr:PKD domain-containing protein [Bacteroidales bacterium]